MKHWIVIVIVAMFATAAWAETESEGVAFLEKLAHAEEAAFASLGGYTIAYDQATLKHGGIGVGRLDGHFTVSRDGDNLSIVRRMERALAAPGALPAKGQEQRVVVNGRQVAAYITEGDHTSANLWDYTTEGDLPAVAKALRDSLMDLPMRSSAFGNGDSTYTQLLREVKDSNRWQLRLGTPGPDGHRVLTFADNDARGTAAFDLEVDVPLSGIVVKSRWYGNDGKLEREVSCVPMEVLGGLWLPTSWKSLYYEDGGTTIVHETRATDARYTLHQHLPADRFAFTALGIPNGTKVNRETPNGAFSEQRYEDGELKS